MYLSIENLVLFFGEKQILDIESISIERGELVTLLGPSGCGKSTLLRCITGLEQPKAGSIMLDGEAIQEKPTKERNIGFVFQDYALFPTMSVFENVAFGLKVKKLSKAEINERVFKILDLVDMTEFAGKNVQLLSGGQKQRVALARSLVTEPKVLLLDEPLSALDARIRKQLQRDLRRIQQELQMTMIFVTHDQEEAMRISDRVFVLDSGKVVQSSSAEELYQKPKKTFVAEFVGSYNRFEWFELERYCDSLGNFTNDYIYYLRPELIQLEWTENSLKLPAVLKETFILGNIQRYIFAVDGQKEVVVDRLNNKSVPKISDSLYMPLDDILKLAVENEPTAVSEYS
ncbi:ABC transporter ATP-binding protein [Enterococcus sp. BWR-S5]|uniref:ABC transporter ATP-binding protein n=1 Tax=Enterococcus sp. BWR-S5 TaxID=2787714 RepID=UPI00192367B3|nr:ABC transporter ATP-binding protein [Enterococcus sp. BWR-S5]MBL1225958.1 ABC transporter ATP-binding protein [Enterococcus sp. BWR-S5]